MKLPIFIILIFTYNLVFANWSIYSTTESGKPVYMDSTSIKRNAGNVDVWVMTNKDQTEVDKNPKTKSHATLIRFKCREGSFSVLQTYEYSDWTGRGQIVNSSNNPMPDYEYPPPGSILDGLRKQLCK